MKFFFFLLFSTLVGTLSAQDFQGEAHYSYGVYFEFEHDTTSKQSVESQREVNQQLMDAVRKDYELHFDKTASIYKKQNSLSKPNENYSRVYLVPINRVRYSNLQTQELTIYEEFMSKPFLISDSLKSWDWKLVNETKSIGNYTCYKAEKTEIRPCQPFFRMATDTIKKMDTITIAAWYTPQIPVQHGPDKYWGLPGLIMQLNDDHSMWLCTKVILNPKKIKPIEAPEKGEPVTREEFEKIKEEKRRR